MNEEVVSILQQNHKTPGFHYLFFGAGSVITDVTYGLQNIENNTEVNDQTSFHVFSATKTFTAVAVMQLVQAGRISLADQIQDHIPEYRFSRPVSIKQLLCHQSGLANPIPLKWTHEKGTHQEFNYHDFSNKLISKHLRLKRSPGSKFSYSNLNYLVLGRLIEQVTGTDYTSYITQNILQHLNSGELIGFDHPDSNHATGYHPNSFIQNTLLNLLIDKNRITYTASKEWTGFHPFYINGTPYGGLFATPQALMHFCQAIIQEQLLDKYHTEQMLTDQKNKAGRYTGMGLGWFTGQLFGHPYCCHAGGGGGYYTEIRIYPTLQCGSVIMSNASGMTDKRILDKLDTEPIKSAYGEPA